MRLDTVRGILVDVPIIFSAASFWQELLVSWRMYRAAVIMRMMNLEKNLEETWQIHH